MISGKKTKFTGTIQNSDNVCLRCTQIIKDHRPTDLLMTSSPKCHAHSL